LKAASLRTVEGTEKMTTINNLKPFKSGISGNPGGRPKLSVELRVARRENMERLVKLVHQYVGMSEDKARQRLSGPDALQTDEMIQGQILKAKEGDTNAFKFITEVMCGKIPESDEITPIEFLSTEEKIDLMKQGLAALEAQLEIKNK
jgi:hypothetical protein